MLEFTNKEYKILPILTFFLGTISPYSFKMNLLDIYDSYEETKLSIEKEQFKFKASQSENEVLKNLKPFILKCFYDKILRLKIKTYITRKNLKCILKL